MLGNDFDADGDSLTISSYTAPSSGTLVLNQDQTFTYTPNAGQSSYDSFTYTVSDPSGATSTATVRITVGPAFDDYVATDEDTAVTIDVLANDSVSGTPSVLSASGAQHGTVAVNPDMTVTYTPQANWYGLDSFQYTMENGAGVTDTATVSVVVVWVNDAPVALDDAATTNEDTPVTINLLANDTDIDGDQLRAIDVSQGAYGSVVYSGDGTATYRARGDYNGSDSFSYTAWDGFGGESTATVTITITPVNDAPLAYNDVFSFPAQMSLPLVWWDVGTPGRSQNGNGLRRSCHPVLHSLRGGLSKRPGGSAAQATSGILAGVDDNPEASDRRVFGLSPQPQGRCICPLEHR